MLPTNDPQSATASLADDSIGEAFTTTAGFGLTESLALAIVATLAYVVGRVGRKPLRPSESAEEVVRAAEIARRLESVTDTLRRDLAIHRSEIESYQRELKMAEQLEPESAWERLSGGAERLLGPTVRLTGRVANAYDQYRQQAQALSNYCGGKTDPATGLANSRALDELLEVELSGHAASRGEFSVAILGIDTADSLSSDDRCDQPGPILRAAELLKGQLRESDLLARYGINELVVVMPQTRLYGASVFGKRSREALLEQVGVTAGCGLAQSAPGDTPKSLLARADSALYSAKAAGDGLQYLHNGRAIRPDGSPVPDDPAPVEESLPSLVGAVAD